MLGRIKEEGRRVKPHSLNSKGVFTLPPYKHQALEISSTAPMLGGKAAKLFKL
jgi:hypothetical protein